MDPRIIDLYNGYVHSTLPRRELLARLAWDRTLEFFGTYLK